jgi:hypothetical protein
MLLSIGMFFVAAGLLFFPAAPFILFIKGKDITVPKGSEITGYLNGDLRLESAKFSTKPQDSTSTASGVQPPPNQAQPPTIALAPMTGSVEVHSTPDGAEVYVDGAFNGNAPATLKLAPGQHAIRVTQVGYKDWSREIAEQGGSEVHLSASLDKLD